MSNPFTQFLLATGEDPDLITFVQGWDALEDLVIRIYRGEETPDEAANDFDHLKSALFTGYSRWREALKPYWQVPRIGSRPALSDPFTTILDLEKASDITGNWRIMQTLPDAREALNLFIHSRITPGEE
jgi:hypothetical protein